MHVVHGRVVEGAEFAVDVTHPFFGFGAEGTIFEVLIYFVEKCTFVDWPECQCQLFHEMLVNCRSNSGQRVWYVLACTPYICEEFGSSADFGLLDLWKLHL